MVMKTHRRFAAVVSALLAVSTLATTVPAHAQEERGRWSRGEQRGSGETPRVQTESRGDDQRRGGAWAGAGNANRAGDRPEGSREWNGARDRDRGEWNRDRDRDRGDWNRDRDRQVWNRDRNDDRRWDGNDRRWDRDDRRDWRNDRFDSRQRWADQRRWDRDWRRDNRYDWQRYRSINRGIYRMPRYYAPYGWSSGYRSFSIGIRLNNLLYSQSYWINDPGYYRLPPAYGYMRWVRYYDDALLVDVRDGYVVDVIRNFFW